MIIFHLSTIVIFMLVSLIRNSCQEEILKFVNNPFKVDLDGNGEYNFNYETSNGIFMEETGKIKNDDDENLVVTGSYSCYTPEGFLYTVKYVADKNGFRPKISTSLEVENYHSAIIDIRLTSHTITSLIGGGLG